MSDADGGGGPAYRGPIIAGPDADGFWQTRFQGEGFAPLFGEFRTRAESGSRARVIVLPGEQSGNVRGAVHGGFLLGFVDQAIFMGPAALGKMTAGDAVTLGLSTQFVGAGRIGVPLECVVDVTRQTRRLTFVTGWIEQEGETVLSFQATMRTFHDGRDGGGRDRGDAPA